MYRVFTGERERERERETGDKNYFSKRKLSKENIC